MGPIVRSARGLCAWAADDAPANATSPSSAVATDSGGDACASAAASLRAPSDSAATCFSSGSVEATDALSVSGSFSLASSPVFADFSAESSAAASSLWSSAEGFGELAGVCSASLAAVASHILM